MIKRSKGEGKVKCVVWDLDNTIWNGTLSENGNVVLKEGIEDIIETLDNRGILQSIASKNHDDQAMDKLKAFNLDQYFLYPQINWNSKSSSMKKIADALNISIHALAFIDDQPFEREEVRFNYPHIVCIDALDVGSILELPELNPEFVTEDSKVRRFMYLAEIERNAQEETFIGTQEAFLKSLEMVLTISPLKSEDLKRAEELTVRTNQLNTTGYTYSYEELDALRKLESHKLLIASLSDKYGSYGKIGLILMECHPDKWVLKLFLMSCRVISRGIGTVILNHMIKMAKEEGVRLLGEFVDNDVNRMMYITYKFSGFKEWEERGHVKILENDFSHIQETPDYVKFIVNI